jgi:arsenical pump membrane protein
MERWVGVTLLALGVAGAVGWPRRLANWVIPVAAALADLVLGVISLSGSWKALHPLVQPVAFLLAAVPMALLLDRLGLFTAIATRITGQVGPAAGHQLSGPIGPRPDRRGAGHLWLLAALVTTFFNLDASVVLLTPLYVRVAHHRGWDAIGLAVQPVMLACLASSALPVSNLTNLIAASWTGASAAAFVAHLGLPSAAATAVGWWAYQRTGAPLPGSGEAAGGPTAAAKAATSTAPATAADRAAPERAAAGPGSRGAVVAAGAVVLGVLVGFTFGYLFGVPPWMVALGADIVLSVLAWQESPAQRDAPRFQRRLGTFPWKSVPAQTAAIVLSLGVLAAGLSAHLSVGSLLRGRGVGDLARDSGLAALAANVINNLPGLLVALSKLGHHPSPALWAVLVGVNMGPVVLVTGSLASLLWLSTMHRLGVEVGARDFAHFGVRVGLPAATSGLAVLLAMTAVGVN